MLPVINVFLPILALSGTAGGIVWLVWEAWTWRPAYHQKQRLKKLTPLLENIRSISLQDISNHSGLLQVFNDILEAKVTLEEQFEIPCPGLEDPETTLDSEIVSKWINSWSTFSAVLLPRARIGDLKNARRALNDPNMPLSPLAWGKKQKREREK